MNVDILLGKTLTSIVNDNDEEIIFETTEGKTYKLYHEQDCCENVTVEDICGDLQELVGEPLVEAEEVSNFDEPPTPRYGSSFTWTFYKFRTIKGCVTIRWLGTSNGYYSESVYFKEIT